MLSTFAIFQLWWLIYSLCHHYYHQHKKLLVFFKENKIKFSFDCSFGRFEVKVDGYPPPVIRWYLNTKELSPSKDFEIDHLEDGTSILTLNEVFPDDAGDLMCEAQNENGVATCSTQLSVIGQQIHSKFILFRSLQKTIFCYYVLLIILINQHSFLFCIFQPLFPYPWFDLPIPYPLPFYPPFLLHTKHVPRRIWVRSRTRFMISFRLSSVRYCLSVSMFLFGLMNWSLFQVSTRTLPSID